MHARSLCCLFRSCVEKVGGILSLIEGVLVAVLRDYVGGTVDVELCRSSSSSKVILFFYFSEFFL